MDSQFRHAAGSQPARRLLLLSPFAPRLDASMGGPLVIAQLIVALSRRERPALLYLRGPDEPPLDARVADACEFAIETPRRELPEAARSRRIRAFDAIRMACGTPSWVGLWHEVPFAMTLRSIVAAWQPDIVQAEFHVMGQYLADLGGCRAPAVLNHHEPGAAAARDRLAAGLMPGRVVPRLEVSAWQRYEWALARQVDAIVTFTERDREVVQAAGASARLRVIAPGTMLPEAACDPAGAQPPALLFFGNYLHAPNVDAALRLGTAIYPRVAVETPGVRLRLVGDRAPAALTSLASEHIAVPGRVPSLGPYLEEAAVVVVPIRIGGGMRVKVLEALGAGKAVVASPRALEGLDLVDGEQVLVAESDEDFVRTVGWLLRHIEERAALGKRARAWAEANLGWERAAAQYAALYDELLAAPGCSPRRSRCRE